MTRLRRRRNPRQYFELLYPTGKDFSKWVEVLTKRPKLKDMMAVGNIFKAILDRDETSLNSYMNDLLKAHEGIAKHGALRETAEGFLCMSAMSLAYAAHQYDLKVNVKSDYFSDGYLDFLIKHQSSH